MAGSRTLFWVQTLHCLLPRAVEMFWLQLQHGIYGHRHGIGRSYRLNGAPPALKRWSERLVHRAQAPD
jgi:hypothetical protein